MRGLAVGLAVWLGVATACRQTPPEDFPPADANGARGAPPPSAPLAHVQSPTHASATTPPHDGRCVLETPPSPPPAVPPGPAPGCPADPEPARTALPSIHVGVVDTAVGVDAELVRSPHDTARGLMYRTSMPEDRGMLFDLGVREDHKFWMHNTCIPLDLLFVDFDGLIVGIVENAPTLNDDSRSVGCPSRWVLEVNAGWARRHDVRAGQRLAIPTEAAGGR